MDYLSSVPGVRIPHSFVRYADSWDTPYWVIFIKIDWSGSPKFLSTKSFVQHTIERCSTQMYHALKGQHLTFSTHYQPYPHHTPNALDLLPKWLHGSKIQKSRKVDFSTFSSDPSKFRFIEKFLVASTIRTLHDHMH